MVQQTKNKGKDDFYKAFSPFMVDAFGASYVGANGETRTKLRRVMEIWRQRNIFDPDVQNAIEKKINDIDKGRGAKGKLGGSLFASGGLSDGSVPAEMKDLVNLHTNLAKAAIASEAATTTAANECDQLMSPTAPTPTPPVHAARLNQLLKSLSAAHSSIQTTLAARDALLAGLEKVVNDNRTAREQEEMQIQNLECQRPEIEDRKAKVEDAIMKGISAEEEVNSSASMDHIDSATGGDQDILRPEIEQLTPPPIDHLTPPSGLRPDESQPSDRLNYEGGLEGDGAKTPTDDVPTSILATQQDMATVDPRKRTGIKRSGEQASETDTENFGSQPTATIEDPRRKSFENMTFKRRKGADEQLRNETLEGLDDDVVNMLG